MIVFQRHWQRRGTETAWAAVDPVLAAGEFGVEIDDADATILRLKLGDGVTAWSALPYLSADVVDDTITNGVTDRAPSQNAVFDALAGKQPFDANLTAWAAINPADHPDCRLEQTAIQTIGTGVVTSVTWDVETYDPMGMHSLSSNTDRVVVPYNGVYLITGSLSFANNVTGRRGFRVLLNGTLIKGSNNLIPTAPTGDTVCPVNCQIYAVAGDILTTAAFQDSGGNLNLTPGGCALGVSLLRRY